MPRKKPLPVGPYGKPGTNQAVKDREERKRLQAEALDAWTGVLRSAVTDPTESLRGISGGVSHALRDLLHTWNVHREKAERIELGVALSYMIGIKNKGADTSSDGKRAPDSLKTYLLEDVKEKRDDEKLLATQRKEEIEGRLSVTVVPNLIDKLAGRAHMSLRDAHWLIAVVVLNWPKPIGDSLECRRLTKVPSEARKFALKFLKALVLEQTPGMSNETRDELEKDFVDPDQEPGGAEGLDRWVFPLVQDGETRDALALVSEAAKGPGGLIIASSDKIFIEDDPVASIEHFAKLADLFTRPEETGLLIFIVDAGFLHPKARINRRRSLFNIHVLISALTSFAVLGEKHEVDPDGEIISENLERWHRFKKRCCIVLRDFRLIQSEDFSVVRGAELDKAVRDICGLSEDEFAEPPLFRLGASVDDQHVLPHAFPDWVDSRRVMTPKDLTANQFHLWNVLVDDKREDNEPEISYFIVPKQEVLDGRPKQEVLDGRPKQEVPDGRGPTTRTARRYLTGGIAYLTQCQKSRTVDISNEFDRAQRNIYRAARGRLLIDAKDNETHRKNMRAVAELRGAGFEVMPVEVALTMLSNFPSRRSGQFAPTQPVKAQRS